MKDLYVRSDAESGRVVVSTYDEDSLSDAVEVEVADDFDCNQQLDYRVVKKGKGWELVHDPLPEVPPEPSEIEKLRTQLLQAQTDLTQTQLGLVDVYEMLLGGM